MNDDSSSPSAGRAAIERRLVARRRRARAMARARARSTHIIFVLVVGAGLLMVVPRYPGILILMAPPFAILLAWALGAAVWRIEPLRRVYLRQFDRAPGFWLSLLLGSLLLALPIAWGLSASLGLPDSSW